MFTELLLLACVIEFYTLVLSAAETRKEEHEKIQKADNNFKRQNVLTSFIDTRSW